MREVKRHKRRTLNLFGYRVDEITRVGAGAGFVLKTGLRCESTSTALIPREYPVVSTEANPNPNPEGICKRCESTSTALRLKCIPPGQIGTGVIVVKQRITPSGTQYYLLR